MEEGASERPHYNIIDKIKGVRKCHQNVLVELKGPDVKYSHFQEHGFQNALLVKEKTGLGMRVPSQNFTTNDVKKCIGSKKIVEGRNNKGVKKEMSMKEWSRYFDMKDKKGETFAIETLEFSGTKLETYVEQPKVVHQLDWAFFVSSTVEGDEGGYYPKFRKYCSMSVSGHFWDFRLSYGGCSEWIHLLHGKLVIWLISPTNENYHLYAEWKKSGSKSFLGDVPTSCQRLKMEAGWTLFIPSGWIAAQYTMDDTLVFGGQFLNSFCISNQIKAYKMLETMQHGGSDEIFPYPHFKEVHWHILDSYLSVLQGHSKGQGSRNEMISDELGQGEGQDKVALSSNEDTDVEEFPMETDEARSQSMESNTTASKQMSPQASKVTSSSSSSSSSSSLAGSNVLKVVTVKLENCLLVHKQGRPKLKTYLTTYEVQGLKHIVEFLLDEGFSDLPHDLAGPDEIINDAKKLLQDQINNQSKQTITGKPVLLWVVKKKNILQSKSQKHHFAPYSSTSTNQATSSLTAATTTVGSSASQSAEASSSAAAIGSCSTSCQAATDGWTNSSRDAVLRRRRVRCKKCEPCTRSECGECHFCRDMKKFGGQGKMKQTCVSRQCLAPVLSTSAVCSLCGKGDLQASSSGLIPHPSIQNQNLASNEINKTGNAASEISTIHVDGTHSDAAGKTIKAVKCGNKSGSDDGKVTKVTSSTLTNSSDLMECSICWKITHPLCLKLKHAEINNMEGVINEDLPSSWECPLCCEAGKSGQRKSKLSKAPTSYSTSSSTTSPSKKKDTSSESGEDDDVSTNHGGDIVANDNSNVAAGRDKDKMPKKVKVCSQQESGEVRKRARLESSKDGVEDKKSKITTSEDKKYNSKKVHCICSPPSKTSKNSSLFGEINGETISPSRCNLGPYAPQYVIRPTHSLPPPKLLPIGDSSTYHPLEMEHWLRIFACLGPKDLSNCMLVCRIWNSWCYYTTLWGKMDVSRRLIKKVHLIAIAKRQPQDLDLSHTNISREQLSWLAERIFRLRRLKLTACSWTAVSCFGSSSLCPALTHLDLSWVSRLDDSCLKSLLSPPTDNRPGVMTTVARLQNCMELNLAGSEISNASVELITRTLTKLQVLDLSYCIQVTSKSVDFITGVSNPSTHQIPGKLLAQQSSNGKHHSKHVTTTTATIPPQPPTTASATTSLSMSSSTSPFPNTAVTCSDPPTTCRNILWHSHSLASSSSLCYTHFQLPQLKKLLLVGCSWIENSAVDDAKNARPELEIVHTTGPR